MTLLDALIQTVTLGITAMSHPVHLILSAGTRIVTRNDANRIGGGPLIAAGSVAVIVDSPLDAQHAYKVRFNDGAEAMLRRTEFSILNKKLEQDLRVRLDEHRVALLNIKSGNQPWVEVNAWRLQLHKDFDDEFASTKLPERPDYTWVNDFLLRARREQVG